MRNYHIQDGKKVWEFGCYTLPLSQEFLDKEFEPTDLLSGMFGEPIEFQHLSGAICSHNSRKIRMQCSLCRELDAALGL